MTATLEHRYPVALERIVRGHTRVALNPATILISLANNHVHAGWLVNTASRLMKFGGTHGALDTFNSTGSLLSSFAPTQDTTSGRVAGLYGGFPGLRDYRSKEQGAEWVSGAGQALVGVSRRSLQWARGLLPGERTFLHLWSPRFHANNLDAPVELSINKVGPASSVKIRRSDPEPRSDEPLHFTLPYPVPFPGSYSYERVYALPTGLVLKPYSQYRIMGWFREKEKSQRLFTFIFVTDGSGAPVPF
jgi:hypothetical protein